MNGIGAPATARCLVPGAKCGDGSKTPDRFGVVAEAPGAKTHPRKVLHRVGDLGEFPVEHCRKAVVVDDHVAVAEVGVDERDRRFGYRVRPQPGQPGSNGGPHVVECVELCLEIVDIGGVREARERRRRLRLTDGVESGERLAALVSKRFAGRLIGQSAQDVSRHGASLDAADDECRGADVGEVVGHGDDVGYRHADLLGQSEHGGLRRGGHRSQNAGAHLGDGRRGRRAVEDVDEERGALCAHRCHAGDADLSADEIAETDGDLFSSCHRCSPAWRSRRAGRRRPGEAGALRRGVRLRRGGGRAPLRDRRGNLRSRGGP